MNSSCAHPFQSLLTPFIPSQRPSGTPMPDEMSHLSASPPKDFYQWPKFSPRAVLTAERGPANLPQLLHRSFPLAQRPSLNESLPVNPTLVENYRGKIMDSLFSYSATELAQLIANQQLSSEEVVQTYIQKIQTLQPLQAMVFERFDKALQEARALDVELAQGHCRGALHGVPITVKDWIDVEGLPCAGSDVRFLNRYPERDATVIQRLRRQGAIILGKTAALAKSEAYGTVVNPHHWDYSPGGSSSGEAALIAAYGSPLGIGSDSGGSIRQPAGYCGIFGLKPTAGRLPLTGHFPEINPLSDPRTVIGPMARSVEDLALALQLMEGPDGEDSSAVPVRLYSFKQVCIPRLKIAFYTETYDLQSPATDPELIQAVERAAALFQHAGCKVQKDHPQLLETAMPITRDYWARHRSSRWDHWESRHSSKLSADDIEKHLFKWDQFRRSVLSFMQHYDLIITPIAEKVAFHHNEAEGGVGFTAPYSLTGQPAVVVPVGFHSKNQLPIGIQLVSAMWREDIALAAAEFITTVNQIS
jgi:amidase